MNLVDIYNRNPEFVRQLGGFQMLDAKILGESVDGAGNTLLHKAAMNNDMTTFNSIKAALPGNAQDRASFMNTQNAQGDTAAHIAVRQGNHAMVTAMRSLGADLTISNNNNEYIMSSDSENMNTESLSRDNVFHQTAGAGMDTDGFPGMLSSTEPYVAPTIPSYDSPAFQSPDTLDAYSTEDVFMKGGNRINYETEGDDPMSLSEISTEDYAIMGGGGKKIHGIRTLYFEDLITSDSEVFQDGGKKVKESSQLHDEAIRMIMDMGYSEDDARIIKAAIYRMVKDKYPDANNLERAKKMIENINSSNISEIDISKVREAIRKNREAKETIKGEKITKPAKKTTAKKTTAKKTTKKKTSKRS